MLYVSNIVQDAIFRAVFPGKNLKQGPADFVWSRQKFFVDVIREIVNAPASRGPLRVFGACERRAAFPKALRIFW